MNERNGTADPPGINEDRPDELDLSAALLNGTAQDVALIDIQDAGIRIFTYDALNGQVSAIGRGLRARFGNRPFRVAILSRNRADFVALYFGIMRAGGIAVPFNWRAGAEAIAFMAGDAEVDLIVTDDDRLSVGAVPVIRFGSPEWDALQDPGPLEPRHVTSEELCEILYTSGSTGRPKGVPLTHAGRSWAVRTAAGLVSDGRSYRVLVAAPMFHMNALFNLTRSFFSGASVALLPTFTPARFSEALVTYRCDWITGVPPMVAMLARYLGNNVPREFADVRQVFIGSAPYGETLYSTVRHFFPAARIFNAYGTTEAGPTVFGPHPDGLSVPPLSCGYPLFPDMLRLVDDQGQLVPGIGQGSLHMQTPATMRGYLKRPEATAQVLRDGWYDSRDIMRRDADGFFYFIDRADDMFSSGGENIYPAEVERVLEQHPDIDEAVVVPLADPIKHQVPAAFVVVRDGTEILEEAVKSWFLGRAAPYLHPRRIFVLRELPLAQTNKVNRAWLREKARELASLPKT
jgi:long-chain acyl-CoA synthetase